MRTPRRRLSPEDRRAELLALGAEVFGQRPYDEVRIDEIAERAGVSRALMYHYFPDKRAFFAAVVKGQADQLFETTNTPPNPGQNLFEEVRDGVLAYMQYHQEHPHAAWAAYVGLGRSDPVLLGIDDEAKDRQMEHIMSRIVEVDGSGSHLEPDCRTRPPDRRPRLAGADLRVLPAAHHSPGHRRGPSQRFLRALAARCDHPGEQDSRATGQGGRARPALTGPGACCRYPLARWRGGPRIGRSVKGAGAFQRRHPRLVRRDVRRAHPRAGRCLVGHRRRSQHPGHRPDRVGQDAGRVPVGDRRAGRCAAQ